MLGSNKIPYECCKKKTVEFMEIFRGNVKALLQQRESSFSVNNVNGSQNRSQGTP